MIVSSADGFSLDILLLDSMLVLLLLVFSFTGIFTLSLVMAILLLHGTNFHIGHTADRGRKEHLHQLTLMDIQELIFCKIHVLTSAPEKLRQVLFP